MIKNVLERCNASQRMAICHDTGPALVIAGPGSGKTFVITGRIANLIQIRGVPPQSILTITFTKAAAAQMQKRAISLIGTKAKECAFGTFHSVFYKILQTEGYCTGNAVLSDKEAYRIISDQLILHKVETDDRQELIKSIRSEISKRKVTEGQIHCTCLEADLFEKIYTAYCKNCRKMGKLDFDDLVLRTEKMLSENPDILSRWQNHFRYIQVDEFQDIDPKQYGVIKLLSAGHQNIFVVGDDDQSIYSFRGADPGIMRTFKDENLNLKMYLLDTNYRCGQTILSSSMEVISQNRNRFEKEMHAGSSSMGKIIYLEVEDDKREAEIAAEYAKKYRDAKKTVGILSRTGRGLKMTAQSLEKREIPFLCKENLGGVKNHFITKDILAYLLIAYGKFDKESMLRIMNKPERNISRIVLTDEVTGMDSVIANGKKFNTSTRELIQLNEDLRMIQKMSPGNGMKFILRKCGYERYLKSLAKERGLSFELYRSVLDEIASNLSSFKNRSEFLKEYSGNDNSDGAASKITDESIVLATLHGVKGLEYDAVIILDLYQGNIPYKKAVLEEQTEEERRLFYVGMTRAKEELILMYPKKNREKESLASVFVLPKWGKDGNVFNHCKKQDGYDNLNT